MATINNCNHRQLTAASRATTVGVGWPKRLVSVGQYKFHACRELPATQHSRHIKNCLQCYSKKKLPFRTELLNTVTTVYNRYNLQIDSSSLQTVDQWIARCRGQRRDCRCHAVTTLSITLHANATNRIQTNSYPIRNENFNNVNNVTAKSNQNRDSNEQPQRS